jgi:CheY-like chemotaxis protein
MDQAGVVEKKVLVANQLEGLFRETGFFDRSGIRHLRAGTNDELLQIHSWEKANLIVTQLDMPGIPSEELFSIIRSSEELRDVSSILVCKDTLAQRERCKQCSANAVFTTPVDIALLQLRMQQFLNVAIRKDYRAVLAVAIQGRFRDRPLPFFTENISANGMLIRSEEPLAKGDGIFFSFFLPNGVHISGYGEIVRVVKFNATDFYLYGIRFTNLDPEMKAAIDAATHKR